MPVISAPIAAGSGPAVRSQVMRDFTGGLNLRDDPLQLPLNESPDLLDVDLGTVGGFGKRAAFQGSASLGVSTSLSLRMLRHAPNEDDDGVILVGGRTAAGHDKLMIFSSPFDLNAAPDKTLTFTTDSDGTALWSSAFMKRVTHPNNENNLFIRRGPAAVSQAYLAQTQSLSSEQTDCASGSGPGFNYHDDFSDEGNGTGPRSNVICTHLEYLFHADIQEDERHRARIRWSHPGAPGDYRQNDFIDVGEGLDNDSIRAMVSAYGALFIFKQRSVWMLDGFDADTFSLNQIVWNAGCSNMNAAAMSQFGLVFFDDNLGMQELSYARGASGRVWMAKPMWETLRAALVDGRIVPSASGPQVTWAGSKVFVGGLETAAGDPRIFVNDTLAGAGWSQYGARSDLVAAYTPAEGEVHLMIAPLPNRIALQNWIPTERADKFNGTTSTTFTGHLTTAWASCGDPSLKKRFRRFSLVFDNQPVDDPFNVLSFKNWRTDILSRTYVLKGTLASGDPETTTQVNVRSGTIGSAYSTALFIEGQADRKWFVNQLTLRYVPQRIT